jgi:hypothetical protein
MNITQSPKEEPMPDKNETRTARLSDNKGVIEDEGKLVVFDIKTGHGIIFTPEEVDNLATARAVML